MATKKTVIVTGFEPFGEHAVNASWVAVQELECLGLGEGVELQVYELPVEYQAIQRLLPSLWKCHQPQLVVHVGVSGIATTVTLEQYGHNHGYCRLDNSCFCPASQCCVEAGPDCLTSDLDMELVCRRLGSSHQQVELSVSRDAGRYLCDYTYYTSLLLGGGRVAFVHVPPLGRPYSGGQLGRALQALVGEMLLLLGEGGGARHGEHQQNQDRENQDRENQDQQNQDRENQDQQNQDQQNQDQQNQDRENQDRKNHDQQNQDRENQDRENQDQQNQDHQRH